jgi:ABC-type antimicrobial peptide transport system permease subunit
VGIAGDTKTVSIRAEPDLQMYVPLAQRDDQVPDALVVRTQGDAATLVTSVRYAMQSTSSGFPFADVRPLATYLEPEMRPWRLGALMCALFGAAAVALAAVGLYGVFAYAVSRRGREIGIRGALGARSGDILWLVMLEGLRLSAAGIVIGIVLALGMGRLLGALLVGVTGTSPVVLGGTAAFVLCVTLLAVSLPARRAARLDPAVALRAE